MNEWKRNNSIFQPNHNIYIIKHLIQSIYNLRSFDKITAKLELADSDKGL